MLRFRPECTRDLLVVVLTLATGATDAIGFISLGGVFTSVMTGNMVLLGVSGGKGDGALALHTGAAFVGYIVGSWLGARIAGHPVAQQPVWPSSITMALVAELGLLAVFGVWWEVAGGHPSGHATYALIAINAVALGIQSGAVIRFGVSGLSTTYLTGTLTHVVASFTRRQSPLSIRSVAILAALVGGAGLGAVLTVEVPRAAPAAPLGVLVIVLLGATATFRRSWRVPPDPGSSPRSASEPG
jgi:uncharacterized membrane protein YoaK (UPF0700 family)